MTEESYLQSLFAERIGGPRFGKETAIYKFEKIKRAKRAALAANPEAELFDLGVGEPDEMAFPGVVETLCAEARRPENRGYADNGGDALKAAAPFPPPPPGLERGLIWFSTFDGQAPVLHFR